MEVLTKRQEDVLICIKKHLAKFGYPPTVREIGELLNLNSPATIHYHLTKLEEKGFISKDSSKNRSIELLVSNEYVETDEKTVSVAHLGKITAGSPIEAIETPNEYFDLPVSLIPTKGEIFTLLVDGDSMINKGIHNDDIVIIKKQPNANNGDLVAAMTDEYTVTLKTFYKEKDHIRLQPENDSFEPIILKDVTILGKAVGLYRKI